MRTSRASVSMERLARPQRLGIFGYRGVGKTTLISMLYREAVAGRLPGLRLAAADTRSAEYLADKIAQLEAGQYLPATLAETDVRLNLYHGQTRIELEIKDYQGEHVELGRTEPIHAFLRDCDAIWLCVDAACTPRSADLLRRQQEIEHLIEHYLQVEPKVVMERPFALILTKSDLLATPSGSIWADHLGMTCHALETHCSTNGLFAVSSLRVPQGDAETRRHGDAETGRADSTPEVTGSWHDEAAPTGSWFDGDAARTPTEVIESLPVMLPARRVSGTELVPASPPPRVSASAFASAFELEPRNLAGPIGWLVGALQRQDEARLEDVFAQAAAAPALLARALETFARRYPQADCLPAFERRLVALRRQQRRRRGLVGVSVAATVFLALWAYDALGYQYLRRFESLNADNPAATLTEWQAFQQWHPTRNLLLPAHEETEKQHMAELAREAKDRARTQELADLRRVVELPDADADQLAARLAAFHKSYPEVMAADTAKLREEIGKRRSEQHARRAKSAFDELIGAEQRQQTELPVLVARADDFLRAYPDAADASDVRLRRVAYLQRIDERDIATARLYSKQYPLNFHTRREKYAQYLNKHPSGGNFSAEALSAIERIDMDWDKHDFRAVRDQFINSPADVQNLAPRCRSYLAAHPRGRFVASAQELLRWTERVTHEHDYRVVLKSGTIDKALGLTFSYGPDTSVELIVNGVRYGPSTIAEDTYEPSWNFEFPRPVRWKMGDTVRIVVSDHDWKDRVILNIQPDENYPLAMWYLAGPVHVGKSVLHFESDFNMPVLPPIE